MVKAKRILILMSDTGGGHRAAAEAIREGLVRAHGADAQVEILDVFRHYVPGPLKFTPELYPIIINRSKPAWGLTFKLTDSRARVTAVTRGVYYTWRRKLCKMLEEHPADVIVSVHPAFAQTVSRALGTFADRPPFLIVVTDLVSIHALWFDKRADRVLVPTPEAFDKGVAFGVEPGRLRVTGLPVHPHFADRLTDKAAARRALGWDAARPQVLLVGGGEGMGALYKIARAINERRLPCELNIIAGRNRQLKARLESESWGQLTRVYPFVTNMPQLMAASDVLVTKAGPATISEACMAGLPIIISDMIPGQEEGNVAFVTQAGAGEYAPTPDAVADTLARWLDDPAAVVAARQDAAHALARPHAVADIADEIWHHAQQPRMRNQRPSMRERLGRLAASLRLL